MATRPPKKTSPAVKRIASGAKAAAPGASDQELCLMGVTRLSEFVDFVQRRTLQGPSLDPIDIGDRWRRAARVYEQLAISEAGAAEKPEIRPLSRRLQAHVDKLVQLPQFRATFCDLPVAFGLVELDKLVLTQHELRLSSVDKLVQNTAVPLTDSALAAICLPLTPDTAEFKLKLNRDGQYVFASDTHDARFLGAQVLQPQDVPGLKVHGHPAAVVALAVGFSTNVLNVIRYRDRVVINNGYHRAMALRRLGVTHAPCLIQVCGHWEDVGLAGNSELYRNASPYLTSPRPPLLRDFDNPALTAVFDKPKIVKQIQLSYEVSTFQLDE
jgi:hypothetical protein